MDEKELDEKLRAKKEKYLTAYGKKLWKHIDCLEKYLEVRHLEKSWENYFDKSRKPNQILVVESGYDGFKILALLTCANDSLAERILSYPNSEGKIYKEDYAQYYVCGILNDHVSAIWQFETPRFLHFWTHLLGRGMQLEPWKVAIPSRLEQEKNFYYLDFE